LTEVRSEKKAPDMKYYECHFDEIEAQIERFLQCLPEEFKKVLEGRLEEFAARDAACWSEAPAH
jgi:hypothetical protein